MRLLHKVFTFSEISIKNCIPSLKGGNKFKPERSISETHRTLPIPFSGLFLTSE